MERVMDHLIKIGETQYRVTSSGDVYITGIRNIPLVTTNMEFSGKFKKVPYAERLVKSAVNNRGYLAIKIKDKTTMVHRLVAECFIPNPDNKPCVNHLDGNKLNNSVENLEWCTIAENNAHARENGLHIQAIGHKLNYKSLETKKRALSNLKDKSKLTDEEVRYVRSVHKPRDPEFSATALSQKYGISVAAMSKVVNRLTYTHIE